MTESRRPVYVAEDRGKWHITRTAEERIRTKCGRLPKGANWAFVDHPDGPWDEDGVCRRCIQIVRVYGV